MILDVLRALVRRWYVLLLGILITFGVAFAAYKATPPEYHARGLVLLLPSKSTVGTGGNPFLDLSGLEQPASIVVAYFSSTVAQDDIAKRAPNSKVTVALDESTRGPVILIDVTDKSASDALATVNYIAAQIPVELSQLQQQVQAPTNSVITSMPLTIDTRAEVSRAGTIRLVIAAVVLGLVLTGIVAFAVDGILLRRAARRTEPTSTTEAGGEPRRRSTGPVKADLVPNGDAESHDSTQPARRVRLRPVTGRRAE